jgi:hypothetical protein
MKDDETPNIDEYLPDAATVARAQDSSAADAAAEKLRADEELRAIVQAQREAELAPPPPAPPSTAQVHLEDVRPNPVPGRLTKPRAYLNLASPDLKRGAPTVKVERAEGAPLDASADTIPRVERRWPWAVLVGLAVLGAFWLALSLGGPTPQPGANDANTAPSASNTSPSSAMNPTATSIQQVAPSAPGAVPTPRTDETAHPSTTSAPIPAKTAAPSASQDSPPPSPPRTAETTSAPPNPPPPQPSASGTGMTFDYKKGTPQ